MALDLAKINHNILLVALPNKNLETLALDIEKLNVETSKTLLEKSIKNDIETFINVSSANAFSYGSLKNPGDETK